MLKLVLIGFLVMFSAVLFTALLAPTVATFLPFLAFTFLGYFVTAHVFCSLRKGEISEEPKTTTSR